MKFGEYKSSEQLLECLQQYMFDKKYDHKTVDLVLEALSKIYMHRIFIFENSIGNPLCRVIGEKFTKCINLIKRWDHYNNYIACTERYKNFLNFSCIVLSITINSLGVWVICGFEVFVNFFLYPTDQHLFKVSNKK